MTPIAKDTDYEQASNNRPISIQVGGIFVVYEISEEMFYPNL